MRKTKIILLTCLLFYSNNVYATGGGLRKNSIKTCPDGVTYGMHSDGKGGTHWHVAITNGKNYYADGEAIYYDPCPESTTNNHTAGPTGESNDNLQNSSNEVIITPTNDIQEENNNIQIQETPIDNNLIKEPIISNSQNQEEIIENNNNQEQIIKEESTKDNFVKPKEKPQESEKEQILFELKINKSTVSFNSNNKARKKISPWKQKVKISYNLNDSDAILKIYKDNKEIKNIENIKINTGTNSFKIKITNKNIETFYELDIIKQSTNTMIILFIIASAFLIGLPIIITAYSNKKR